MRLIRRATVGGHVSAARLACTLIQTHRLEVVSAEALFAWQTLFERDRRLLEELKVRYGRLCIENEKLIRAQQRQRPLKRKRTVNRFAVPCKSCGQPLPIGDLIWWRPEFGAWHLDCPDPPLDDD
jgi:hypothetical protein